MAKLCKRDNLSVLYFILPPYALTSISIFSVLLSVYFLWYWQGELIKKSKFVRVTIIFLYSSIFLRCAWWNNSRKRGRWIDSSDFNWYTFVGGNFKTVSNNYFIIVLRQVILLPLYHGVSEFPLFQSLLRLGWGCRNPLIPRILLHHFFCRKNVHYCSNCFHRITVWYWDFPPHIQWLRDYPGSRFSGDLFSRKIKKDLTPVQGWYRRDDEYLHVSYPGYPLFFDMLPRSSTPGCRNSASSPFY